MDACARADLAARVDLLHTADGCDVARSVKHLNWMLVLQSAAKRRPCV